LVTPAARLALVLAAAAIGSACLKAEARTPAPTPPPLEAPAPPGRVIIPVTVRVPEPPPPVVEPEPPPARPPASAGSSTTRPPDRASPPSSSQPPPVLQTTSNTAAIEVRVRELVSKARGDLARIDRGKLRDNARDQYDTAQRFIQQAEENLKIKNHLYAQQLAESAAALAGGLVKGDPAPATGP
jgi:hypothetical protein